MARLAAIAKSLYYPTQDRVLSLLLDKIKVTSRGEGWILDPCCGKGVALEALAKNWGLKSLGVELDAERQEESKSRLDSSYLGSIHQVRLKGTVSAILLNPPYDYGEEGRQELEFLRVTERFMEPDSFLIYIVPMKILNNTKVREIFQNGFTNIKVWKYPEPEFQEFKQIVILGQKKKPETYNSWRYGGWYNFPYANDTLEVLGETEDYEVTLIPSKPKLSLRDMNPDLLVPTMKDGVYGGSAWDLLVGKKNTLNSNPLMPPRNGHRAMMLVSGYLNGLEIEGKLIKGTSVKSVVTIEKEGETIERERIDSVISELDLVNPTFSSWNAREDVDRTLEWFNKNGNALSSAVDNAYTPLWNGDLTGLPFHKYQAPGVLPGKSEPEFLEAQKQAAAAINFRWKTYKTVILCGEQGIGKTTVASLACGLFSNGKNIIICPSHLVDKWKRETCRIFKNPKISRIAEKISDVQDFFSKNRSFERFLLHEPEPKFLIISKERAKLGAKWEPSFIYKERKVKDYYGEERIIKSYYCPDCQAKITADSDFLEGKRKISCEVCKSPLWQSTCLSEKGTKRWALAHYISKHYPNTYNVVLDETHAFAKAETDQGKAVQMLCSGARRILPMTGTLYGGRASSLFHLLYKVDPIFREMYGYEEARKFSEQHGLFETVFKEEEKTGKYGYSRGNSGGRLKEIPGVSPTMINLLLHFTIFVKLKDLGVQLPSYTETVEFVDPDPEVQQNISSFQSRVKSLLRESPSLIGGFLMSSLGYVDAPENGDELWLRKENESDELVCRIAPVNKPSLPKDERVLQIVRENMEEGRKVMVYFTQTQKRNPIPRVKAYLESQGLRVEHMPSSIAPTKREAWVKKALERGFDVFLTNGRLVETGLDLLFAHTIIQYGIEYSINSLRQSIRRSWRLGQDKDIRVIFMGYRDTLQADAIQLIAKKMKAAELLDGEDEFSGLSQHDDSAQDFLLELAQKVMKGN